MKSRPILFSAAMIQALLDGRKHQTRRIIKLPRWAEACNEDHDFELDGDPPWPHAIASKTGCLSAIECPYGNAGDYLWCRETWNHVGLLSECTGPQHIRYAASVSEAEWAITKWKPSIFMPRWSSRLTLRITDVRVERLNEISEPDAIAEGIEFRDDCWGTWNADGSMRCGGSADPIDAYRCLWININGAGSWEANPFVWRIAFDCIQANVDEVMKRKAS